MYLQTLFIFLLTLTGSFSLTHAAENVCLQDTIKKVYIKVTAAEKPKTANIDSLADTPPIQKLKFKRQSAGTVISRFKTNSETKKIKGNSNTSIKPKKTTKSSTPKFSARGPKKSLAEQRVSIQNEIRQAQNVDSDSSLTDGVQKTSKIYLWIGIVLVVGGIILGILFGKTALLISIAGIIFVIIGYTIKS